ncbi:MAG: cobyric acid synthase [Lautropia sp.]
MSRTLVVWGCTSGAGKSWIATALCRAAARRGIDVAPYKAQNMSNNARVVPTVDGGFGEIGSAQYLQALAAGTAPVPDMNPVLLKPETDTRCQVVVDGRVVPALGAVEWRARSALLAPAARAAFERLASRHELVVVEGAGSPAEINLQAGDFVNLEVARWAMARGPVHALLVADIDRGGAFAHLYGSVQLLPADLRPLVAGFVLNRFRGDAALLAPGPARLQALTGVPTLAVVPMVDDHGLAQEDAWSGEQRRDGARFDPGVHADRDAGEVVIVATPRISNLDEFEALSRLPAVRLRWARHPQDLVGAGLVILPGSKQVSGDLAWLRARGLDRAILRHARAGLPLLGICAGAQMLGHRLDDPAGVDGVAGCVDGLGVLPVDTRYEPDKRLRPARFAFDAPDGAWAGLASIAFTGYEIRHGRTSPRAPGTDGADRTGTARTVLASADGAAGWQHGNVLGITAHGLFESDAVLRALFGDAPPGPQASFERLADAIDASFDPAVLDRLLGAPRPCKAGGAAARTLS